MADGAAPAFRVTRSRAPHHVLLGYHGLPKPPSSAANFHFVVIICHASLHT